MRNPFSREHDPVISALQGIGGDTSHYRIQQALDGVPGEFRRQYEHDAAVLAGKVIEVDFGAKQVIEAFRPESPFTFRHVTLLPPDTESARNAGSA